MSESAPKKTAAKKTAKPAAKKTSTPKVAKVEEVDPVQQLIAQNAQLMASLIESQKTQSALLEKLLNAETPAAPQAPAEPTKVRTFHIRNLRGTPFSLRLSSPEFEKPFRVELKPRGLAGDMRAIPEKFRTAHVISDALNRGIVELLTDQEARDVIYTKGAHRNTLAVPVVREENTVVRTTTVEEIGPDGRDGIRNVTDSGVQRPTPVAQPPQITGAGLVSGAEDTASIVQITDPEAKALIESGVMEVLPTRRLGAPLGNVDPAQLARVNNI